MLSGKVQYFKIINFILLSFGSVWSNAVKQN